MNPVRAAVAPAQSANRYPTSAARLSTFGPGKSCPSARRSTNSRSVSQCRRSTNARRAQNTGLSKLDSVT